MSALTLDYLTLRVYNDCILEFNVNYVKYFDQLVLDLNSSPFRGGSPEIIRKWIIGADLYPDLKNVCVVFTARVKTLESGVIVTPLL